MTSGYNEQTLSFLMKYTYFRERLYLDMSYGTDCHSKPEHPQLIFIHGYGTTSLVHALAEEYSFKVKIKNLQTLVERKHTEN